MRGKFQTGIPARTLRFEEARPLLASGPRRRSISGIERALWFAGLLVALATHLA